MGSTSDSITIGYNDTLKKLNQVKHEIKNPTHKRSMAERHMLEIRKESLEERLEYYRSLIKNG